MLRSIGILCALMAFSGLACGKPAPPPPEPAPDPSQFSGERAWEHLERLVEIGPRVSGTPGAEAARSYIRAQLEAVGLEPRPLSFDVQLAVAAEEVAEGETRKLSFESILAEIPGESTDLVVLAAPFDSRHFASFTHVGANNGASGAALLLEMARVLSVRSDSLYGLARLPGRRGRPWRGRPAGPALPGEPGIGERDPGGGRALAHPTDGVFQSGRGSGSRDRSRSSLRTGHPQVIPERGQGARSRAGLSPGSALLASPWRT